MDTKLAQRLHDYILKQGSVTMTDIYKLGTGKYTRKEISASLVQIHKMKDISRKMKGGDVVYGKIKPKKIKKFSQEEIDEKKEWSDFCKKVYEEWDQQCKDYEKNHSEEHKKKVKEAFSGVGNIVLVGNSYVPESNLEYYNKVLKKKKYGNSRR